MSGAADELGEVLRRAALAELSEAGGIYRAAGQEYVADAADGVDVPFRMWRRSGGRLFLVDVNVSVTELDPSTCAAVQVDPHGRFVGPCRRPRDHDVSQAESHAAADGTRFLTETPDGTFR